MEAKKTSKNSSPEVRAGRADGDRPWGRVRLAVGGDLLDRGEGRLQSRDAARLGPAGRAG